MDKYQAQTILEQMGGTSLLTLMIGAENFTFDSTGETGCRFKFKMSKKANLIDISIKDDLYTMKFFNIQPLMIADEFGNQTINPDADYDPQPVQIYEMVENNKLVEIFEDFTKLSIKPVKIVAA